MAIATILGAVAPFLFRFVESKLGAKTGPTKMQTVLQSVKPILSTLATGGHIGPVPEDSQIVGILEGLLQAEKSKKDWQEAGTLQVSGKTYRVLVIGEI